MRILVIGGGFISRHLVTQLVSFDHDVTLLCRSTGSEFKKVSYAQGDIRDVERVERVIQTVNPEAIFCLAAFKDRKQTTPEAIREAIEVNVLGTSTVLGACVPLTSLKSIVVLGTAEEYGVASAAPFDETQREQPLTAYTLSKTCQTHLCQTYAKSYNLPIVVLRPTIVYGPGQGLEMFLPALIVSLLKGVAFKMTAGEQKRDYLHIKDLIRAMTLAVSARCVPGEIINVGYGESMRLAQIADRVAQLIGRPDLLKLGALPYRHGEVFEYVTCIKKAARVLNWAPAVDLNAGLQSTVSYYQNTVADGAAEFAVNSL